MKKRSRFRNYLSLEALVILFVLAVFHFVTDKRLASLFASFAFLGSTLAILFWETRFQDFRKRPSFWGGLLFLISSVLPILALRLIYWNASFNDIGLGPWTGAHLHRFSNYAFMMMMICFFIDAHLERVREKEENLRT